MFGMINQLSIRLIVVFTILIWPIFTPALAQTQSCHSDYVDLRGKWGQVRIAVELADTPETRAKGLMFRKYLPPDEGMLFIFDAPTAARFWMKNTLIPLDMIFVLENGRVHKIHENAKPRDLTNIIGGNSIKYVLEVPAGTVKRLKISKYTVLRHSRIPNRTALWNCP